MIKIAHLITDTNTAGAETMLYRLVSRMSQGFENIVVSITKKGDIALRIEALGIKVYTLNNRRRSLGLVAFLKLIQILFKERPQIIQTWLYQADLFGLLAAKIVGIKIVLWNIRCSCADIKKFSLCRRIVLGFLAKLSRIPQAVIFNSEAGIVAHRKIGYLPRKSVLINNGFELDVFYPRIIEKEKLKVKLFGERDLFIIGSVSRFDPLKDHETFLKAVKIFIGKYSGIQVVKFVIVGSGMSGNPAISKLIKLLDIERNVVTKGERNDIPDIISSFDVYCSSSLSEGFPNTIGEAMASGIPCVATDAGDSAFLIGKTGIVVPVKNPEALADAWLEMISIGQEGRIKLGLFARSRIESEFSIEKIAGQYEVLFSDLLKNK